MEEPRSCTRHLAGLAPFPTLCLTAVLGLAAPSPVAQQAASLATWTSPMPPATWTVAQGDLDGDGDADLACGSWSDLRELHLLRAAPDGSLGAPEPLADLTGLGPLGDVIESRLAVADLDGDGDQDLLAVPRALLRQDATGSLGAPEPFLQDEPLALMVAVAELDVDGDGDLDVLLNALDLLGGTGFAEALVARNDGAAHFSLQPAHPEHPFAYAAGHLNLDGRADLLGETLDLSQHTSELRLYRGQAGGSFGPGQAVTGLDAVFGAPTQALLADLDGDGRDELIGDGIHAEPVTVWSHVGNAHFQQLSSAAVTLDTAGFRQLVPGDLDGDGDLDLLRYGAGLTALELLEGDGHGGLTSAGVFGPPSLRSRAVAWDRDGDGRDELAVADVIAGVVELVHGSPDAIVPLAVGGDGATLAFNGATHPGAGLWVSIDGQPAGTPALLLAGLDAAQAPAPGGLLALQPLVVTPTSVGALHALVWPDDLPAGLTVLAQPWVRPAGGPWLAGELTAVVAH